MENQDSANPNPISNSQNAQKPTATTIFGNPNISFRGSHHRRAHSEVNFRIPNDLDLVTDPFDSSSFDEIGSEDDFFCAYMDIEKLGSKSKDYQIEGNMVENCIQNDDGGSIDGGNSVVINEGRIGGDGGGDVVRLENDIGEMVARPRHRHCISVDGSSMISGESLLGDALEAKKAMSPDKLAELWTLDPKRAKRILANRQSAARSKERKARYMIELEQKVQTLQTEATTLSAQLTLYQRDTACLTTENTELKLRLYAMERQAQLRNDLNEALKQEVERLKIATGKVTSPGETFDMGMHHIAYTLSSLFSLPQQQRSAGAYQNIQLPQFHPSQSAMTCHPLLATHSLALSEMLQQDDPLGRLQGLDIGRWASEFVKSECPSISASQSSSTS